MTSFIISCPYYRYPRLKISMWWIPVVLHIVLIKNTILFYIPFPLQALITMELFSYPSKLLFSFTLWHCMLHIYFTPCPLYESENSVFLYIPLSLSPNPLSGFITISHHSNAISSLIYLHFHCDNQDLCSINLIPSSSFKNRHVRYIPRSQ